MSNYYKCLCSFLDNAKKDFLHILHYKNEVSKSKQGSIPAIIYFSLAVFPFCSLGKYRREVVEEVNKLRLTTPSVGSVGVHVAPNLSSLPPFPRFPIPDSRYLLRIIMASAPDPGWGRKKKGKTNKARVSKRC